MSELFPGDQVRFLDQDGNGVVLSVKNGNVLVQTPDGFEFPYPESSLVRVNTESSKSEKVFKTNESDNVLLGKYGLYMAYVKKTGPLLSAIFINKTSYEILFSLTEETPDGNKGFKSGRVPSGRFVELYVRSLDELEQWPNMHLNIIYHNDQVVLPAPASFRHRVVAKYFHDHVKQAPIVGKESFLYQLDGVEWQKEKTTLNTQLKDAFQGKKIEELKDLTEAIKTDVVDLHLEAIPDVPVDLGLKNILKFQMDYAEKMLDKALAAGMSKITFIHGAGDGVLKREIQRLGREHQQVSSFGKGDPNKYGGGATFLKLR